MNPTIDDLIGELLADVLAGLDRRLTFEAWADARPVESPVTSETAEG